jgi:hypothetical protein
MIDYRTIETELVRVAREGIGQYLSTTNGIPSIIIERPIREKPDYPYLTLDLLDSRKTNGRLLSRTLNEDESVSYVTEYSLLYQYTVYGSNKDLKLKAHGIAQHLSSYFELSPVLEDLQCNASISMNETGTVENVPQQINADEWLEVALFTVVVNVYDSINDTRSGVIDKINIGGDLYRDQNDQDPLPIDINLP